MSAIIGSAILYGDFKKATFHQFVTFMYGCGATFTGVWIIAWVPTPEGSPTPTGPNNRGAINDIDAESRDPFISDDVPAGAGVGRKSVSVPVLESRRSKVSLVGISPAQVQSSIFRSPENQYVEPFCSASFWSTHHLGPRFISDKNMMSVRKRDTLDKDGAFSMGALEGGVESACLPMTAPHLVAGAGQESEVVLKGVGWSD